MRHLQGLPLTAAAECCFRYCSRILLDTGEGVPSYLTNLRSVLKAANVTSLSAILLSHWHHDHTGGLADVRSLLAPGAGVFKGQGGRFLPSAIASHNRNLTVQSIEDGQLFETEGATLQAIATPGHTEDHMCFLLKEEQAVFSGDTVLGAGTGQWQRDSEEAEDAIRRLALILLLCLCAVPLLFFLSPLFCFSRVL